MFNAYSLKLTVHFNKSMPACHFEHLPAFNFNDVTCSDWIVSSSIINFPHKPHTTRSSCQQMTAAFHVLLEAEPCLATVVVQGQGAGQDGKCYFIWTVSSTKGFSTGLTGV